MNVGPAAGGPPVVALFNNAESFFPYISRSPDPGLMQRMYDKGNRALLWAGDPKLVFLSAPAPHLAHLRDRAGYSATACIVPSRPSHQLSLDIASDPDLLAIIDAHAGPRRAIQLIPYATTRELYSLAETLRQRDLEVLLPESPAASFLWLRDYLDSKAGFRLLAGEWLGPGMLAEGYICRDRNQAAEAAAWLTARGRSCIVKADRGNGGFGHTLVAPSNADATKEILSSLEANPFFSQDGLIVEERISSPEHLFPAVEIFVPAEGSGRPYVTHICTELFLNGKVTGQIVTPSLRAARWHEPLAAAGLTFASHLQSMGFAGHFDLDAVIDERGQMFLLEANARRTAGTHAHEFAIFALGDDYQDWATVICHNTLKSGTITSNEELLTCLADLLYPIGGRREGIVVTHTASLREGEFGCIIVASQRAQAETLQTRMIEQIDAQACQQRQA